LSLLDRQQIDPADAASGLPSIKQKAQQGDPKPEFTISKVEARKFVSSHSTFSNVEGNESQAPSKERVLNLLDQQRTNYADVAFGLPSSIERKAQQGGPRPKFTKRPINGFRESGSNCLHMTALNVRVSDLFLTCGLRLPDGVKVASPKLFTIKKSLTPEATLLNALSLKGDGAHLSKESDKESSSSNNIINVSEKARKK
jgi:hypothetical protein